MVQLEDYSNLRAPVDEKVTIPLNGVNYHAAADVAADVALGSTVASSTDMPEIPEGMTMEQLAESNPGAAARLSKAGGSSLMKALDFIETVMEPDSWEQWQANMKRPEKGLTPAKRKAHLERMITLPQMLAVFKALLKHYTGRPTTPSAPSQNGVGGTGGTSTDGAPATA